MKVAVSADCFGSFTSGFPVRGMMLALIKGHPEIHFQLYYTRRPTPPQLKDFYDKIHSLPNVEVRYFKDSRKAIALKRLLGLKYVTFDKDTDLFLSPGNPEYIRGYKGPSICSLADLSTLKGIGTGRHATFFKYWGRLTFNRRINKHTRIVTISDFTRGDLLRFNTSAKDKAVTIYNGISDFWFDDIQTGKSAADFGLDSPYFIWWGLISRRKNIDRLIEAYRHAKKQQPHLPKLLLVGGITPDMEYIKASIGGDVMQIHFQDDATLRNLVRDSKGLIFPSLYEGFGLPVIEAFSQGVPVACSNVTSLPEVANGRALLFDPESIDSIARIIPLLEGKEVDPNELKRYARQFSYDMAARKYMELINELTK